MAAPGAAWFASPLARLGGTQQEIAKRPDGHWDARMLLRTGQTDCDVIKAELTCA